MAQEALANQLESADDPQQRSQQVNTLLSQYRSALMESGLPKVDVEHSLKKLGEKPPSELNPEHLRANLEYIKSPEAKEAVRKQTEAYAGIIDNLIKEELFSSDPAAKALYIKWLLDEPFDKREEIIKQPFFKIEDRKKAKKAWERIPSAERAANPQYAKLGVEERLALVEKLGKKHEELKNAFHKLPEKIQEKHWKEFKELNLRDREAFLKNIKAVGKGNKASEGAESQDIVKDFKLESQRMVEENLLAPSSKMAHDAWFENLSPEQQKNMQWKSDLHTRMKERIDTRDAFLALDPNIRKPYEFKFKNRDLDKRKELLAEIGQEQSGAKAHTLGKNSYPDAVLQTTIQKTLHDPSLHQQRSVFTLIQTMSTLRRREELTSDTRKTDTMVEKAEERGAEIDDHQEIIVEELKMHGDERFGLKQWLKENNKLARPDAKTNNATLKNRHREEVSAERFQDEVVDPQHDELVARVVEMASQRLPGADRRQMEKAVRKTDLRLDLQKEAA
ncbi:MAG: hypothetical protein AAB588_03040 [Patescibacteria group bacterium]